MFWTALEGSSPVLLQEERCNDAAEGLDPTTSLQGEGRIDVTVGLAPAASLQEERCKDAAEGLDPTTSLQGEGRKDAAVGLAPAPSLQEEGCKGEANDRVREDTFADWPLPFIIVSVPFSWSTYSLGNSVTFVEERKDSKGP